MGLSIKKNTKFGESSVTVIGITRHYGRPQYILVSADNGGLKFPGLRYRAASSENETLEYVAKMRFEEQTGLKIDKMLGLRTIMPTRSRHEGQWIFRQIFLGVVDDLSERGNTDIGRTIYLADPGIGIRSNGVEVTTLGRAERQECLDWVVGDNREVAQIATDFLHHFNWEKSDTNWYRRIPCVGARPLTDSNERPLGCGLAVASMILLYKPEVGEPFRVVLVKRKGDKHPGLAGGKIETPDSEKGRNLDPVSCCIQEGAEELGFGIRPSGLICCAHTALEVLKNGGEDFYVSIDNMAFVAEPINPSDIKKALQSPQRFLEGKMESYVCESIDVFRERVDRGELRMPDMAPIGREFYRTSPGQKIPLTHVRASGVV